MKLHNLVCIFWTFKLCLGAKQIDPFNPLDTLTNDEEDFNDKVCVRNFKY